MEFEEWWAQYLADGGRKHFNLTADKESSMAAWQAATLVEREECAKVCDAHTVDDVLVNVGIAQSCATMIRQRGKEPA